MSEKKKQPKPSLDEMLLRLGTARSTDSYGQAVLPETANLTAGEQVIVPEEERNLDFNAGS